MFHLAAAEIEKLVKGDLAPQERPGLGRPDRLAPHRAPPPPGAHGLRPVLVTMGAASSRPARTGRRGSGRPPPGSP